MATRLLIVDDDPEITSALVRGLKLHGYDAEAANRADLALVRLDQGAFEGAIVDVMLGADNGLDLVRSVRARGIDIPILMLSALTEVEDRAAGLAAVDAMAMTDDLWLGGGFIGNGTAQAAAGSGLLIHVVLGKVGPPSGRHRARQAVSKIAPPGRSPNLRDGNPRSPPQGIGP